MGWRWVLCGSVLVWVGAQFGLRAAFHSTIQRLTGWDLPLNATGAFDLFAWQLLWVLGLWFGALGFDKTRTILASSRTAVQLALAVSCIMFIWRHYAGPAGFSDPTWHLLWVDKWSLSAVRLVNLASIVFVLIGFGDALRRRFSLRLPPIEALGRASMWVFAAHIGSVLFLLCLVGQDDQPLGGAMGLLVISLGYLALFAAAAAYRRR